MVYQVQWGEERARIYERKGDLLKIRIGEGLCVLGSILERNVMYEIASILKIYEPKFPEDVSAKEAIGELASASPLMCPILTGSHILRSGFAEKIGKMTPAPGALESARFISSRASGKSPLAPKFDPSVGSWFSSDMMRGDDVIKNWEGKACSAAAGDKRLFRFQSALMRSWSWPE